MSAADHDSSTTTERVYLGQWAEAIPDREALIIGDGEVVLTYAELEARSNQVAHAIRALGLEVGDGLAIMLDNNETFVELWWGGMRSGTYMTPINWHLTASEVEYLLADSQAKVLVFQERLAPVVAKALAAAPHILPLVVGDPESVFEVPGVRSYEELVSAQPTGRIEPEAAGGIMFYSSGTTGKPKGIRPPLSGGGPDDGKSLMRYVGQRYGVREGARYLSPGPLYHSAPITWTTSMHTLGSTSVVMRRFDAEQALALIDHQKITHVQFVPTMFQRIANLPDEVKAKYDLSSIEAVWHAAAPCPIHLKRQMVDLFGPVLWEYYAGSEGGGTIIGTEEWLERPGSVGRHWTGGTIKILDPVSHEEMPTGEEGLIYFEPLAIHRFEYHNDPDKTSDAYHGDLFTIGDIGKLDEDGYLYLTDRKSNMIISGGVNIYPQEIENVLSQHPAIADAAVFGVPHDEFGEQVMAAIQLQDPTAAGPDMSAEIERYCRESLAGFKVPRRIEFFDELPRDANGKLYKRHLRDRYWEGRDSKII